MRRKADPELQGAIETRCDDKRKHSLLALLISQERNVHGIQAKRCHGLVVSGSFGMVRRDDSKVVKGQRDAFEGSEAVDLCVCVLEVEVERPLAVLVLDASPRPRTVTSKTRSTSGLERLDARGIRDLLEETKMHVSKAASSIVNNRLKETRTFQFRALLDRPAHYHGSNCFWSCLIGGLRSSSSGVGYKFCE